MCLCVFLTGYYAFQGICKEDDLINDAINEGISEGLMSLNEELMQIYQALIQGS